MAQSSRSRLSASNDPIENLAAWFQTNSKPILIGAGVLAASAAGMALYRSTATTTRERASAALFAAQAPLAEGKYAEAQGALEKVVSRYGSTGAGQQAVLLLAQALFEQNKVDDAVKVLEKALSGASGEQKATLEALLAAASETKGDPAGAAAHYGKAAEAAPFASEKRTHQAAQARSLMAAGKSDEAKSIWESLLAFEGETVAQEAAVRLGEIGGRK